MYVPPGLNASILASIHDLTNLQIPRHLRFYIWPSSTSNYVSPLHGSLVAEGGRSLLVRRPRYEEKIVFSGKVLLLNSRGSAGGSSLVHG